MLVNLTKVLTSEGSGFEQAVNLDLDIFSSRAGIFTIVEKEPVNLKVSNMGNDKVLIQASTQLCIVIPCARCLGDVKTKFRFDLSRDINISEIKEEQNDKLYEVNFIEGYNLDVDKLIYSEILINWPMKVLCSENCKGICKQCGANLNEYDCGHDTTELDPRMAVIKDIFRNME